MKFSEARRFADTLANGGNGFSEVDLFEMFNVDISEQSCGGFVTPSILRAVESCGQGAVYLWGFRPLRVAGGVVDHNAITREERGRRQKREQAARAEMMAEKLAKAGGEIELAESLPAPKWLS